MKKALILGALALIISLGGVFTVAHLGPLWRPTVVTAVSCPHSTMPPKQVGVGIQPRNSCTPSYNEQDVRAYFSSGFSTVHGLQVSQITISRILFTTSSDASRLMGGVVTGEPDSTMVCYVEMRGTITGQATGLLGKPAIANHRGEGTVRAVFDAHTGELLVASVS